MRSFDPDVWQELGDVLRGAPLRTALTMAGVFWGTFVLVLMLGFASGLETATERTVRGMATNAVFVWGGRTNLPYRGLQPGRWIHYVNDDVEPVRNLPGVRILAPRNQLGGYRDGTPVTRGAEVGAFSVMGDVPDIAHVSPMAMDAGRFLDELDVRDARKVAVIGRQVWTTLFPDGEDPIGSWIAVRGMYFQVIGTFHSERGGDDGDRAEQTIHVPFSTFQRAFDMADRVQWFAVLAEPDVSGAEVETQVKALLADRHDVHPDDAASLGSFNAEEEYSRIRGLFRGIRGLTWIVGTATLLSGAVGVSNVLLIVVRERTKEIGLRRAIGATPVQVVTMVLREALVLTGVAGLLGLVCGVALVALARVLVGPDNPSFGPPQIDPTQAITAAVVLALSGVVAGLLPARRAVAITPVDALRAE
jgi:putative ABC transport system permease protein